MPGPSDAAPSVPVPRLASDVTRAWLAVGLYLPVTLALPYLLIVTTDGLGLERLFAVSLLLPYAFFSFVAGILNLVVFRVAESDELRRWLVATTPSETSRRSRFWHAVNGGGSASWAIYASVIAVLVVVLLSTNSEFRSSALVVWSGVAVVVGAWFITVTAYAVGYARQWAIAGGLEFPGDTPPRFSDFVYLAVQVSTTFSSSDVAITDTRMRRIVTSNSLVSFCFNTVIVALLVSVLLASVD